MFCPSCGNQIGENYCPGCGAASEQAAAEEQKPKGIGVGGTIILLSVVFAMLAFYITSNPRLPAQYRLPTWLEPGWMHERPASQIPTSTPVVILPGSAISTPPPPAPRDPYETLSETTLRLSDGTRRELLVRLLPDNDLSSVAPLLIARAKELRGSVDLVEIRVYPAGSEGLTSDTPLITLTALPSTASPGTVRSSGAVEVAPGIYRTPAP